MTKAQTKLMVAMAEGITKLLSKGTACDDSISMYTRAIYEGIKEVEGEKDDFRPKPLEWY